MHRVVNLLLLGICGLMLVVTSEPARAQTSDLDRRVREIALGLRCPVCQNLSVADSPSPLAVEMRGIIRHKLQAGESSQAIIHYFVASYGEEILLDPPRQGCTLLVWLGAVVSVAGGLFLLAMRLRCALSVQPAPANLIEPASASLTGVERQHYEARLDAALVGREQGGV